MQFDPDDLIVIAGGNGFIGGHHLADRRQVIVNPLVDVGEAVAGVKSRRRNVADLLRGARGPDSARTLVTQRSKAG